MNGKLAIAEAPIADSGPIGTEDYPFFDQAATVLSQYANSAALLEIINRFAAALDPHTLVNALYDNIWNIETAVGYGLDVLGRIVGVNRVIKIPTAIDYLGFQQQSEARPFGFGVWYGGPTSTQNFALTDDAYRRLILAKAALNISDGSIPAINAALLALFPERGNSYVRDDGGMSMTYVFGEDLSPVEYAIVAQSGVLPKPIGVSVQGEVA